MVEERNATATAEKPKLTLMRKFDAAPKHFFDMAARDGHELGWKGSMEKLSRFLQHDPK